MGINILITGASGMLGYTLCKVASETSNVTGVYYSNSLDIESVRLVKADLTDKKSVRNLLSDRRFDAVIHTAAFSSPGYCQENPEETRLLNVESVRYLCKECRSAGTRFVFTSSDLVFNGNAPPYKEGDKIDPVNIYGMQKAEAEKIVLKASPSFTVCRLPLMFGDSSPFSNSFIQHIIHSIESGHRVVLFRDEYRTPVSAVSAARGLLMAANGGLGEGIVHLGGRRSLSRYEIGLEVSQILGSGKDLVKGNFQKDKWFAAPRPSDVSLDSSHAYDMGYSVPDFRKDLLRLRCIKKNSALEYGTR